ncbi:DNA-methyltransferase [Streptomyces sp. NPDC059009]|uniref:DNA-methyltransferase n=1 Tax=Streptomyces sp. NPDC059009 TaxID=3346694 RepID=UPI0036C96C13
MIHHRDNGALLLVGDALEVLSAAPEKSVNCIVTSPPYFGLRDYGTPGQYGLEATPAAYVETMRALFDQALRVLADDGTLWLNLGDSYYSGKGEPTQPDEKNAARRMGKRVLDGPTWGLPRKNLIGIPWRVAFALQDDGWILRNEIIWHKPNAMPQSVTDRLSVRRESLFLFSKKPKYWFDLNAIREPHSAPNRKAGANAFRARDVSHARTATGAYTGPRPEGKNPGDVWSISTRPFPRAHFATFPVDLPLRCITAGCKPGGIVLDPFSGAGTTGLAARQLGRHYIGIDLNPEYHDMAMERFAKQDKAAA